jgi:uncharacterized protein (DUF1778 family)
MKTTTTKPKGTATPKATLKVKAKPASVRLDIRTDEDWKVLVAHASALEGVSVADFIRASVKHAAQEVVHTHQLTLLAIGDSTRFEDTLANPPAPSSKLKELFDSYAEKVSAGKVLLA